MSLATKTKPKSYHKKRQARHHRQSQTYAKTYWPYLPMLLIVVLGVMLNSLWSARGVLGASSNFTSSSLLSSTNTDRSAQKEAALSINPQLSAAAQAKADDMVKQDYWSHISPEGKTPWDFITASGYQYTQAGENLAYGFSSGSDVVAAWMNSPEHRANILNASYQDVGFGVAQSNDYQGDGPETVVVAEYAEPAPAAADISFQVNNPKAPVTGVKGAQTQQLAAEPVSRLAVLTGGNAAWATLVVVALASVAATLFVVRHGLRLRRLVLEGEAFVIKHPGLDLVIVFVCTAAVLLTRTSGLIR